MFSFTLIGHLKNWLCLLNTRTVVVLIGMADVTMALDLGKIFNDHVMIALDIGKLFNEHVTMALANGGFGHVLNDLVTMALDLDKDGIYKLYTVKRPKFGNGP
jgi:hypothetical protein